MAPDPLAELVDHLESHGTPALHWVVRWSAGGRDPVAAAWDASNDPVALVAVLALARGEPESVALESVLVASRWRRGFVWSVEDRDPRARLRYGGVSPEGACVSIRRAVPEPPTLAQLIEATRGR